MNYNSTDQRHRQERWLLGRSMMWMGTALITTLVLLLWNGAVVAAEAGDPEKKRVIREGFAMVKADDPWQPEGFEEAPILRAAFADKEPILDGLADDPAWAKAEGLTVPLAWGEIKEATVKAVYTGNDIYLQVSWADPSKDDQHHPWMWDEQQGRYSEGPQVEDGLLVSLEVGCEWEPSLLAGIVYDFDGWLWLAGRTNPLGQAVDVYGNSQDRWIPRQDYKKYPSRYGDPVWNLKVVDGRKDILTKPWQALARQYLRSTPRQEIYVRYQADGEPVPVFAEQVPPPPGPVAMTSDDPGSALVNTIAVDPAQLAAMVPQFRPVKLTGNAGEVAAKGHWQDGRWTVEFRRALVTPARTTTDSMFMKTTQFSLHVFDQTEDVNKASESVRLLLEFVPDNRQTPDVLTTQNGPTK